VQFFVLLPTMERNSCIQGMTRSIRLMAVYELNSWSLGTSFVTNVLT
jgi:hypothetical protein